MEPGHLFLTPGGGDAYEMRYVSKSDDLIQNVQLHLDAQFLAKIGQETADLDPLRIELLERSAVRDLVIEQICLMLKRELEQGGLGSQLYAESTDQPFQGFQQCTKSTVESGASRDRKRNTMV